MNLTRVLRHRSPLIIDAEGYAPVEERNSLFYGVLIPLAAVASAEMGVNNAVIISCSRTT